MSVAIHQLVRNTAVLLLLVSLPGFLPVAAQAQHLVRVRGSSPAEENSPVKGEEALSDADHATFAKRLRHPRSRSRLRHLTVSSRFALVPVESKPFHRPTITLTDSFAEQLPPLRC